MKSEADAGKGESGGNTSEKSVGFPTETKKRFEWSGAVPEGVVCPACWGDLSAQAETLVCAACARRYPVVDGIPVLIVERAEQRTRLGVGNS
jgi:hypothetical protein